MYFLFWNPNHSCIGLDWPNKTGQINQIKVLLFWLQRKFCLHWEKLYQNFSLVLMTSSYWYWLIAAPYKRNVLWSKRNILWSKSMSKAFNNLQLLFEHSLQSVEYIHKSVVLFWQKRTVSVHFWLLNPDLPLYYNYKYITFLFQQWKAVGISKYYKRELLCTELSLTHTR